MNQLPRFKLNKQSILILRIVDNGANVWYNMLS